MPCCWSNCGPIPLADPARCQVWVADLGRLTAEHEALLDATERARAQTYVRAADRARFVLGAALLKLAVGDAIRRPPYGVVVDRTCDQCGEPHGRPRIQGAGIEVSVAHSGSIVVVAMTPIGPVGVDVEQRAGPPDEALVRRVLAPSEPLTVADDFLIYWCRKESVLKATGDGLRVPMTDVLVSAPQDPPSLLSYRGEARSAAMFDLDLGLALSRDYPAALTILTSEDVAVRVDPADRLLAG
jgi:4'-phosphopantetheinyl transferase